MTTIEEQKRIDERKEIAVELLREAMRVSREYKEEFLGKKLDFQGIAEQLEAEGLLSSLIKEREKIVYQQTPFKSTEEELAYQRLYRQRKKELQAEQERENRIQMKINRALSREKATCYNCHKVFLVTNPTHCLEKKRNSIRTTIIILAKCSECGHTTRLFGGYTE